MPDCSFGIIPFRLEDGVPRFLLVRETWGEGHWNFPKGHAERGEAPLVTALRELREETGLVPDEILETEALVQKYSFEHEGRTIERRLEYFIGRIGEGDIQLQEDEVERFRWVTIDEFMELVPFPESRETVREAYRLIMNLRGSQ